MAKRKRRAHQWPKVRKNSVIFRNRLIPLTAFGRKLGLDPAYLSRLFHGQIPANRIPVVKAQILATAFNCTIEELVEELQSNPVPRYVKPQTVTVTASK